MIRAVSLIGLLSFAGLAHGLEIPLGGGTESGEGSAKIGYVDMERIFQVYPQTRAAKDDYRKRLEKLKLDLTQKEAELGNIRDRIAVLDSTLKGLQPPITSTDTSPSGIEPVNADSVGNLKKNLEAKQQEYEDARKRAQEDLVAFENQQSQIILGKIYVALRELADEEQLALVVDKSSILYGSASTDLTEKLQQRIRGF